MTAGQSKTASFGNWQPASITAHKFNDLNGDSVQNPGEPDLRGWEMTLYTDSSCAGTVLQRSETPLNRTVSVTFGNTQVTGSGTAFTYWLEEGNLISLNQVVYVIQSITDDTHLTLSQAYAGVTRSDLEIHYTGTDSDGNYTFTGLPAGTYYVKETLKSGWTNTTSICQQVAVAAGESATASFGNWQPATVIAHKFDDQNGDGTLDVGEPGLSGWTMTLYSDAACTSAASHSGLTNPAITGAGGDASFLNLPGGDYYVKETGQAGWTETTPVCQKASVSAGQTTTTNVGNWQPASITAHKFNDQDGSGLQNGSEPDLQGWVMTLYSGATCSGSALGFGATGSDGTVTFAGLPAGDYSIRETLESGWTASTGTCQSASVSAGGQKTINFGNWQPAVIAAFKFNDLNGSKALAASGEPGLAGWTMTLYPQPACTGTALDSGSTDTSGIYTFTTLLKPGTYYVQETAQAGWIATTPACQAVTVEAGQHGLAVFGNWQPAAITAHKFNDLNGSGAQNGGEPPLQNWEIALYEDSICAGDPVAAGSTDSSGDVRFDGLRPGTYYVEETLQPGWTPTTAACRAVSVAPGEAPTVDVGNWQPVSILAHKFNDLNGDGAQGSGEPGLDGWTMTLYPSLDCSGTAVSAGSTDANGDRLFSNLPAGNYSVKETLQDGWTAKTDVCQGASAAAGQTHVFTFGNWQPNSLIVHVFNDLNKNGLLDEGEPDLSGWTVMIYSDETCTTQVGSSGVTDAYGRYVFTNLNTGTYYASEVIQAGWTNTTGNCLPGVVSGAAVQTVQIGNYANPTAVTLVNFSAASSYGQVTIRWTTAFEYRTVGFNLYRSTSLNGRRVKLNGELIPSQMLTGEAPPYTYEFVDRAVRPGIRYYYWLEEIDTTAAVAAGQVQAVGTFGAFLPIVHSR